MIQEEEKKPIPVEENKENDNLEADEKKYYKEQHKLNTWVAVGKNKRYFLIDQQLARHFVHYSEWYTTPSLLCNSNNYPFSYFMNLNQL